MIHTIHILAANYRAYTAYLESKNANRYSYRYLDNISVMYGLPTADVIVLSGSESRTDYKAVLEYCQARFDVEYK